MNKAASAAHAMMAYVCYEEGRVINADDSLNPHVTVITHQEAITPTNALRILGGYDLIVDCTDRPYTRYLLSDASVLLGKTLVSGAAIASAGQWAVYGGTSSTGTKRACYRCMWPRVIGNGGGNCDEVGVWGPVVGMVGIAMAQEVLRVVIGLPGKCSGRLGDLDLLTGRRAADVASASYGRKSAGPERQDEAAFCQMRVVWARQDN